MKILHGTWIPQAIAEFVQTGGFYLWVETDTPQTRRTKTQGQLQHHPRQLFPQELVSFVTDKLGLSPTQQGTSQHLAIRYFLLPSTDSEPLPSPELSRYLETEFPAPSCWQYWAMDCYQLDAIIKQLSDIHFLCLYDTAELQLGSDLLFWYRYTQSFREIILKDHYIPALKYRELSRGAVKRSRKPTAELTHAIYPGWEIISDTYQTLLHLYSEAMPILCGAGVETPGEFLEYYDPWTLLQQFSECLLQEIVSATPIPNVFARKIEGSELLTSTLQANLFSPWTGTASLEEYQKWLAWKQKLVASQQDNRFYLCFQLQEASEKNTEDWRLKFLVSLKDDPSLKLELEDYWYLDSKTQKAIHKQFGEEFQKNLLLKLGYAARIYPKLWQGLDSDKPTDCQLTLAEAFEFLKEKAWILEDAGYKVIVPAWWTPQGRQRAKLRLRASTKKAPKNAGKGYFQLETLVQYHYELAIGDQNISKQEWQQLVNAKTPLVKFRGQWLELDQAKMKQMLEFWQSHQQEQPELTLLDLMRVSAESDGDIEIDPDETLAGMLAKLNEPQRLEPIDNPPGLQGALRDYQKRGVAWIQYLEQLGLNGCLADDMGLGKSVQVIARLLVERENSQSVPPTLLVVPTSVIGNWHKEVQKFAPQLRVAIHHGGDRPTETEAFLQACAGSDVVITSFTLARKDAKLLQEVQWQRLVLDEAQNIKNPKAAQTKAILKLAASHRLALTGTPVENRLLDLWSIFNFLNPGYLGNEAQFRRIFEIPVHKENNQRQVQVLKQLTQPFILRRLKTDQQIIKDLPQKLEQKQYCNLTKEQGSLYEAVVKDVLEQIQSAEGIQRKGLILSTLTKLKQICNHPRQFLQDDSEFTPQRSQKLERLGEMAEEVIAEGESLLVFTQFTDIGDALERFFKHGFHYNTYYLHGGTPRLKREKAIAEFQDPQTPPSVFILSLKAGGVGITLTKANHVFHFDRWWNPAVENQATDRAFRIGQKKNVFVHKFVVLGTLEERIDQMIEDKQKIAQAIVGSDEAWLSELDNESFKQLIALNKQTIL